MPDAEFRDGNYLPGFEDKEGAYLCAALLRGHPLLGLRHVLTKLEGTIWHRVAVGVAGCSNGNGADRLISALRGVRAAGFDEAGTRRAVLSAIAERDGFVEEWLTNDKQYEKRKSINRKRYAGVADMFKDTEWLWPGWIPKGYLSMIAGRPGIGKSTVALWWATLLLRGGEFPDGHEVEENREAQILWIDTEGTQPLLIQRMREMSTPMDRIFYPTGDKPEDQEFPNIDLSKTYWREIISGLAIDERPLWIVIDSLRGSHSGKEKDDTEMQSLLSWAAALSRDLGCAFTFTHHLRKTQPGEPTEITLDSVRGSSAIIAMMRCVVAIDHPDPKDDALRLRVVKSNLSKAPEPIGFTLVGKGTPEAAEHAPKPQRFETLTERAMSFLEARLAKGPRYGDELLEEAEQIGLSKRVVKTAKERLGIVSIPRNREHRKWRWALRAIPPEDELKPWDDEKPPF